MPNSGDRYRVVLREAHLLWGTHSRTGSRSRSEYEAYIPIPLQEAHRLELFQGKVFGAYDQNGKLICSLLAGGSQGTDGRYGKNFSSKGDLKVLGMWLHDQCKAKAGDSIELTWIDNKTVQLQHTPTDT